jgi:D-3-phosphoglycerate dehydrogenase
MAAYHIVVADPLHDFGWETLQQAENASWTGPYEDREDLLRAVALADALIVRSATVVDEELLAAGPRLKIVARAGARLDNVNIEGATRRGVMVINVPEANVTAIVEFTFALLLGLARLITRVSEPRNTGDLYSQHLLGFELSGKKLGIIGYGRIGQEVALRAQAFGMVVLAYDPYMDLATARDRQIEVVNFIELLERADIITLHTSLTPQTQNLLDAEAFDRIKPGAVLINSHHPGLIDEAALLTALDGERLAWAALDGLNTEPDSPDHPLRRHSRVLLSPGLSQHTYEAESITDSQVIEDILDALNGRDYRNIVNLPFSREAPYLGIRPYIHLASKLGKLQGQLAEGWIVRVEVEILGEALRDLVRPVAAALLSGMLRPPDDRRVNWVSAPVLAYAQGVSMAQAKGLVEAGGYPGVIACRIYWADPAHPDSHRHRTVAGVLFGDGEARLWKYDQFEVDAKPDGYVLVLENNDRPGVIGKVGTRLGQAGVNIAHWRYGRDALGPRAVSFINLDNRPPAGLMGELEKEPEILRARLVHL